MIHVQAQDLKNCLPTERTVGHLQAWSLMSSVRTQGDQAVATIGALSKAVAAATAVDPASVAVRARDLRGAGLISSGGRGLSAASMAPRDAAHLLCGVAFAYGTNDAVDCVKRLNKLRGRRLPAPARAKRNFVSELQSQAGEQPIFTEALTALIDLAGRRLLFPDWSLPINWVGTGSIQAPVEPRIEIEHFGPDEAAAIIVTANSYFVGYSFGALNNVEWDPRQSASNAYENDVVGDLHAYGAATRTVRLGIPTIQHIARAVLETDE